MVPQRSRTRRVGRGRVGRDRPPGARPGPGGALAAPRPAHRWSAARASPGPGRRRLVRRAGGLPARRRAPQRPRPDRRSPREQRRIHHPRAGRQRAGPPPLGRGPAAAAGHPRSGGAGRADRARASVRDLRHALVAVWAPARVLAAAAGPGLHSPAIKRWDGGRHFAQRLVRRWGQLRLRLIPARGCPASETPRRGAAPPKRTPFGRGLVSQRAVVHLVNRLRCPRATRDRRREASPPAENKGPACPPRI